MIINPSVQCINERSWTETITEMRAIAHGHNANYSVAQPNGFAAMAVSIIKSMMTMESSKRRYTSLVAIRFLHSTIKVPDHKIGANREVIQWLQEKRKIYDDFMELTKIQEVS